MADGHLSFTDADSTVEQNSLHLSLCNSDLTSVETFHPFVNSRLDHTIIPIVNYFSYVNFVSVSFSILFLCSDVKYSTLL
jgi:hypothetical protein